jgi:hypothetical protein
MCSETIGHEGILVAGDCNVQNALLLPFQIHLVRAEAGIE